MKMMKTVYAAALLISSLAFAQEYRFDSGSSAITLTGQNLSSTGGSEITRLRKSEAILKAILQNAEYIQLKDGDLLEIDNRLENRPSSDSLKYINRAFEAKESTGTGFGG